MTERAIGGTNGSGTAKSSPLTSTERSRLARARQRAAAAAAADVAPAVPTVAPPLQRGAEISSAAALAAAFALAAVSAFFGVVGMTAIFAAAAVPIMIMTGILEAAKLATAAWLARHWRTAPLPLRGALVVMTLALMALTAAGTFSFLSQAHLDHLITAGEAIDRDAAPLAQRVAIAEADLRDVDGRIMQLDDMVKVATAHSRTRAAMELVGDQARARADLAARRSTAAERLAALRVEQAGVEMRRARLAGESGPALYLARLFGSHDTEGAVRLITALLVLVLDPLAVLLTIALARRDQ